MIHLSGCSVRDADNPAGDIAIEFTGLRPGEKLYEELLIGENVTPTAHPMIMRANERFMPWSEFCSIIAALGQAVEQNDLAHVRQVLHGVVDGYHPEGDIVDWLFCQRRGKGSP